MIKQTFTVVVAILLLTCAAQYATAQEYRNGVMEAIYTRASVRTYSDQKVEKGMLIELVKAGMAAPSGANKQVWEFIIVEDRNILDKLGDKKKMFKQAQAAIVVLGNSDAENGGSIYWYQDCSAATQNILLAAHSFGLGAVWTTVHPHKTAEDEMKNLFGLPDNFTPLCIIALGYPNEKPTPKDKWNKEKVHFNRWTK